MLVDTHVILLGERFTFVTITPRLGIGKGKRRPDHTIWLQIAAVNHGTAVQGSIKGGR
jgi:hypothetical protein